MSYAKTRSIFCACLLLLAQRGLAASLTDDPRMLRNLNTTVSPSANSSPKGFIEYDGAVYFSATDRLKGRELFKRTPDGEVSMVLDLASGSSSSNPVVLIAHGGFLYFHALGGLYKTDGTELGTQRVGDSTGVLESANIYALGAMGDKIFALKWGSSISQLWTVDLSTAQSILVKEFGTAIGTPMVVFNNRLYFSAISTQGRLWKTDGTADGTIPVRNNTDLQNGVLSSYTTDLAVFQGNLYFARSSFITSPRRLKHMQCEQTPETYASNIHA